MAPSHSPRINILGFTVSIEVAGAAIGGNCLYSIHILGDWLLIDHTLLSQAADMGLVQANVFPQHLISMLSKRRRWTSEPRRAFGKLHRGVDQFHRTAVLVVDFYDHVACQRVLVVQRPLNIVYRGVRHSLPLKDIQPLFGGLLGRNFLDFCLKLVPVRNSLRIDLEFGVVFPLRLAQSVAEDTKQSVVPATKQDIAVFRLEGLVRDNRC